ncbi:MAG: L-threonylcarbamoyladenylate synthase [Xanthomonadales bacterium]|jgi:L-threonylcarbamoyladenylate synthase|nr:L-threonylcarbamoyladenylate synthase [Xanthomonadales bacterium]
MRSILDIAEATERLKQGELVAIPTETVYGLAADATLPAAVARVFALKGRPADHPLIVHLGHPGQVSDWAREVPAVVTDLAEAFWPGPLTLILKRGALASDWVTGGADTVGLRIPRHPLTLALLERHGGGLAAPSANRYGRISPTTAAHVRAEFGRELPLVLDGGPCPIGIESTILDLSGTEPRILRPGAIDAAALARVLGESPALGAAARSPQVSGSHVSHYAPRTPAELVTPDHFAARIAELRAAGKDSAALCFSSAWPEDPGCPAIALPAAPEAYAHGLYAALRTLDALEADRLLIVAPPGTPEWTAIHDRLQRATA